MNARSHPHHPVTRTRTTAGWRRGVRAVMTASAVAVAGVVALAPAAAAEVDITPSQGVQGGGANVTFEVRNDRPEAYTTTVEIDLPPDQPIAEAYPMSHPDWAPRIVQHPSDRPLPGVHGGTLIHATSAIIWTRASDAPPPPAVEKLRIELGPLPVADSFVFTVVQTYSDGTVQRWRGPSPATPGGPGGPGTVLTLTAPEPGLPSAVHDHGFGEAASPVLAGEGAAGPDPAAALTVNSAAGAATAAGPQRDPALFSPLPVAAVGCALAGIVALLLAAARRPFAAVTTGEEPARSAEESARSAAAGIGPGSSLVLPGQAGTPACRPMDEPGR
jgi:hypothetical protein